MEFLVLGFQSLCLGFISLNPPTYLLLKIPHCMLKWPSILAQNVLPHMNDSLNWQFVTIIFFHYCLNKKFSVTFWILQVTGYQNENYIFQWLITKVLLRHCSNFLQRLLKKNHYWKLTLVGQRHVKSLSSVCLSICLSICPSVTSFLKMGLLVFSDIVHDDSWLWYLVTNEAKFFGEKIDGPNLGQMGQNWSQN